MIGRNHIVRHLVYVTNDVAVCGHVGQQCLQQMYATVILVQVSCATNLSPQKDESTYVQISTKLMLTAAHWLPKYVHLLVNWREHPVLVTMPVLSEYNA